MDHVFTSEINPVKRVPFHVSPYAAMTKKNILFFLCAICHCSVWLFPATGYVSPPTLATNPAVQTITYTISNTPATLLPFPTNSGINFIRIDLPSVFQLTAPLTNSVSVKTWWNFSAQSNLETVLYTTNWRFTNHQAAVSNITAGGSNTLFVFLGSIITNMGSDQKDDIIIDMQVQISDFTTASFTSYVDGIPFEAMLPTNKRAYYSTTGPKRTSGSPSIQRQLSSPAGFASLVPNQIAQGNAPYTFTYYIKTTTNANHHPVSHAAILIPYEFRNCTITNLASVSLGSTFKITNVAGLTNDLSSNLIYLNYSASPLAAGGGLDVITFEVIGNPDTNNFTYWYAWADNLPLSSNSTKLSTNTDFPRQFVIVTPPASTWDYRVISAGNWEPAAMGNLDTVPLSWFSVIADTQDPVTQKLTNLTVELFGNRPNAAGMLYLYHDTNDSTQFQSELLLGSNYFSGSSTTVDITFTGTNQSPLILNPTRYWIAAQITNTEGGVFSNTISAKPKMIAGDGPDNGTIHNSGGLTNTAVAFTRIDDFRISFNAESIINTNATNKITRSSFNHPLTLLDIRSSDPDIVYSFSQIEVFSDGTNTDSDFGYLKLVTDADFSGTYTSGDSVVPGAIGQMSGGKAVLIPTVPITFSNTNIFRYLILADIAADAVISNVFNVYMPGSSNVSFSDPWSDGVTQIASVTNDGNFPLSRPFADIVRFGATAWDIQLSEYYSKTIASFVSNQESWVLRFDAIADVERQPAETIEDILVQITGTQTSLSGFARLFETPAGTETLDTGTAVLISSNSFTSPVTALHFTNLGIRPSTNDSAITAKRYWMTLSASGFNHLQTAGLKITNMRASGRDGGLIDNLIALTNAADNNFNLNYHQVVIGVTNYTNSAGTIRAASFDNPLLKIFITGSDPDATNFLSSIIISNSGTAGSNDFGTLKIYRDDGNSAFSPVDDELIGNTVINAQNCFVVTINPPLAIASNNSVQFFISSDIKLSATDNRTVSLQVLSNAHFVFSDQYSDDFNQKPVVEMTGAQPSALQSHTIVPAQAQPWDFYLKSVFSHSYETIGTNAFVPLQRVSIYQDIELTNLTVLTNISVQLFSSNYKGDIAGAAYLYPDSGADTSSFNPAEDTDLIAQTNVSGGNNFNFSFAYTNVSINPNLPTELWLVFRQTNHSASAWSNTAAFVISEVKGTGANGGIVENASVLVIPATNIFRIDNYALEILSVSNIITGDRMKVGSTSEPYLAVHARGIDPDGFSDLKSVTVSLTGEATATGGMIASLMLYQDDGDGIFNKDADTLRTTGFFSGTNAALEVPTSIRVTNTNEVLLFVAYNLELNDNNAGKILNMHIGGTERFAFTDLYSDGIAQTGYASGTFPAPASSSNVTLIPFFSQPYDFGIQAVSYSDMPRSFSTNQIVHAGNFRIFMDVEETNTQVFQGITVQVNGQNDTLGGILSLYRGTNTDKSFVHHETHLLARTNIYGTNIVRLVCAYSNIIADQQNADKLYLTFELTNDIAVSMTNTAGFKITNVHVSGPRGGIVTNLHLLSTAESIIARADNYAVDVLYISNAVVNPTPLQGSFNNSKLRMGMRGQDPDGTNYLLSITVKTNGLSTTLDSHIPAVSLFLDSDGDKILTTNDVSKGTYQLSGGTAVLTLNPPLALAGTNIYTFFTAFSVSSDDTNAVGRLFGLEVPAGGFAFSDQINDNFPQNSFAAGSVTGPDTHTNISISALTARLWDFRVIQSVHAGPVSFGLSNLTSLSYVDIISDGENPATERLTNVTVTISGSIPDIRGSLYLYHDTNDSGVLSGVDHLLASNAFISAAGTHSFEFNLNGLSSDTFYPARLWLGINVTNTSPAVYSNRVSGWISAITADGPNGGIITNQTALENFQSNKVSRIDDFRVYAGAVHKLSNTVQQGSFNNTAFMLVLSNRDPDSTNFLSYLRITNSGTAQQSDLGTLLLYQDDNDLVFNSSLDTIRATASINSSNVYELTINPPVAVTGTNTVFWILFNVNFSAVTERTVALSITEAELPGGIAWTDLYADSYDQTPVSVPGTSALPGTVTPWEIIPYTSKPYDFYLLSASYTLAPQSITTNQPAAVAKLALFMDTENTNTQVFTGVDVILTSTTQKSNMCGIASLYKDTGDGVFTTNDLLLGNTNVVGGSNFVINVSNSLFTIDGATPDYVFLVFTLTNNIADSKNDQAAFKITNARCTGPNGGIFTNTHILTASSHEVRFDSPLVTVSYISNHHIPVKPKQASFNNCYMIIALRGDDADATNYVSHIDVITNAGHTNFADIAGGQIPYLKVYSRYVDPNDADVLAFVKFENPAARLTFSPPVALAGTNEKLLYIGYDVTSGSTVINRYFGLTMTNGGIGLTDNIADGFPQQSCITAAYQGPLPVSNVQVGPISTQPWDFYIKNAIIHAPVSITTNKESIMHSTDIFCDNTEFPSVQFLTNLTAVIDSTLAGIAGELRLYMDTNTADDITSFNTNADDVFVTNAWFTGGASTNKFSFSVNNLGAAAEAPTRFWLGMRITNAPAGVYNAKTRAYFTACAGNGPDGGVIENASQFTNISANYSRIDDMRVQVFFENHTNADVRTGTFNNPGFKLTVVNLDNDATNFLKNILVTNSGTATNGDLGDFRLYLDNNNGTFLVTEELLLVRTEIGPSNVYSAVLSSSAALTNRTNILWGTYDVNFSAVSGNTVMLTLLDPVNTITFSDEFTETGIFSGYDQRPSLVSNAAYYTNYLTNSIIPNSRQAYDLYLKNASYAQMPHSFTTNQLVPAGFIEFFKDVTFEPLVFTGVSVENRNLYSNLAGFAYLYKAAAESTGFVATNDTLIASNTFSGGQNFSIACAVSNASENQFEPTRMYLVIKATNAIDTVLNDTISLRITEVLCGRSGLPGVFTNQNPLLTNSSRHARCDSGLVNVVSIENYITNIVNTYYPKQGQFDRTYLRIRLAGTDPDAQHFLSSMDVVTNGLSTVLPAHIPAVKLYLDTSDGQLDPNTDVLKAIGTLDSTRTRLYMSPPLTMTGTATYTFFVAYDISSGDNNAIGKKFGLTVPTNAFIFSDGINDSFDQFSFSSNSITGPSENLYVTIAPLSSRNWDFRVNSAHNAGPVSMAVSNWFGLYYFDIHKDGQAPDLEYLTNISVAFSGNHSAIHGTIGLFLDMSNNSTFLTNEDLLVTNAVYSGGATSYNFVFSNGQIGRVDSEPATRFWVGMYITNSDSAVYSSTIGALVTDICGNGPDAGLISQTNLLSAVSNTVARLDDYRVSSWAVQIMTNDTKQGFPNNVYFKLFLSNADPDAVYGFKSIIITNEGIASNTDLTRMDIYRDNGDGVFNNGQDVSVMMLSGMSGLKTYDLTASTPVHFSNNSFFGVFDVGFSALVGNTILLKIPQIVSNLVLADIYDDQYSLVPALTGAVNIPGSSPFPIQAWAGEPYDLRLAHVDYSSIPEAFTAGQNIVVGEIGINGDFEDPTNQIFTGIDVGVYSTGTKSMVNGITYLYMETNLVKGFSTADMLIGQTNVFGGNPFHIACAVSNIKVGPVDTFYLVFNLTNSIATAKYDTVQFGITNFYCTGPSSNTFTNIHPYVTNRSREARIDDQTVVITYISNDAVMMWPNRASPNNPYLRIGMRGNDPDARNYLSHIDVITNVKSTVLPDSIQWVGIYTNRRSDTALGGTLRVSALENGASRIQLISPYEIYGINESVFYIGYSIGDAESTVGRAFGLTITNGSFGFADGIYDNFPQTTVYSGAVTGPDFVTNVIITKMGAKPWEVYFLQRSDPLQSAINVKGFEMPLLYFDALAEWEDDTKPEGLLGVTVTNLFTDHTFSGTLKLYTNNFLQNYLNTNWTPVSSAAVDQTVKTIRLSTPSNALPKYGSDDALRYFLSFTPDAFNSAAQTGFRITSFDVRGLTQVFSNTLGLATANAAIYTNYAVTPMRLENNIVQVDYTTGLPETAAQGAKNILAGSFTVTALDDDASFTLQSLSVTYTGTSAADVTAGVLYFDNGSSSNTFDKDDKAIEGAAGVFENNIMRITLGNPVTVTKNPQVIHLLLSINNEAGAGNTISMTFDSSAQAADAMAPLAITKTIYIPVAVTGGSSGSSSCKVIPGVVFDSDEDFKATGTILNTCLGDVTAVYFKTGVDTDEVTASIYDLFGRKVRDIEISGGRAVWDGKDAADQEYIRSGIYLFIVRGNGMDKSFKIVVRQCE